jgi:hypothetical protein
MGQSTGQGDTEKGLLFEGVFSKRLEVTFDGERQSDFGGLPLLAVLDRRMHLTEALAMGLVDPRQPGKVEHEALEMLRQRVYGIAAGLEDVNDAALLRDDPAVRLAVGRAVEGEAGALASAPSLCRFENRATRRDLVGMGHALFDRVLHTQQARRAGRATRITIDLDPAEDPTYGQQEFTFYNGHYENWCYLPLFAFLTFHDKRGREEKEQHLVAAILRPGNVPAIAGARGLLRRLVVALRKAFPGVRLRARLDGGYAAGPFLDFLESLDLEYVVNLPTNSRLRAVAEPVMDRIVRPISDVDGASFRVYGDFVHKAKEWSHDRRIVLKAEVVRDPARAEREGRDNARFVVTNARGTPEHVYEKLYCRRGEIENRIKELKHGLAIDRTSCTSFLANQMRVLFTAAAYVLLQELRRHVASADLGRPQVATLRERFLLLSARVVESTRRFLVRLSGACPWRDAWRRIARSVGAVPT